MKRTLSLVPVVLFLLTGCITSSGHFSIGASDYVLATRNGPDGRTETYELCTSGATLRVKIDYERERPQLGLQLVELDKHRAEDRGVVPFSGLLVKGVEPKSSAADAGVLAGDVLLTLDKRATVYLAQMTEFESTLRAEQVVTAKVVRGQSELDLSLVTNLRKERVTDTQEVELESAVHQHPPYAGVTLRGIPAAWCQKIYGTPRNAVVVATVEVGSPAWLAGVRSGDVIDTVDGAPVPPVAELSRRIAEQGAADQPMQWSVHRGPGPGHDAAVQLENYSDRSSVWIPLIFRIENGTFKDSWSIGPFGTIMNNRNHYVTDWSTREVQTRNVFNALLGLFHVETTPDETEVRLLWLIHFDT